VLRGAGGVDAAEVDLVVGGPAEVGEELETVALVAALLPERNTTVGAGRLPGAAITRACTVVRVLTTSTWGKASCISWARLVLRKPGRGGAYGACRHNVRQMEDRVTAVNHDDLTVTNNRELGQYEIRLDGALLGLAAYQEAKDLVVFTHTEVNRELEGAGIGSHLIRAALDDVRGTGHRVLPVCPFVHAFITRNPEYADLDYRNHRAPSTALD
jgi:predicted GNAT family acetyltransferase